MGKQFLPVSSPSMMVFSIKHRAGIALGVLAFFGGVHYGNILPRVYAQSVDPSAVAARRVALQQQLDAIEADIAGQQSILDAKQRQSVSLERDIAILDAQIQKSKLSIRARDLTIQKLSTDIIGKERVIGVLNTKLDREKSSLAQLLRKTNEIDSFSFAEVALNNQNLSAFFEDLNSFDAIKEGLHASFEEIATTKTETETAKKTLEDRRSEEFDLRELQVLEKRKLEQQEIQKQQILKQSRGVEAVYQKIIADKQRSAAQIRAELFSLAGSTAISFEKALAYANTAGAALRVRPAFILGIIAEESNLGANVGKGTWMVDMHPTRDVPVFRDITTRLGLNPDVMPVSKKQWYGWGGAMGPAQFIPSTWVLYEGRIAQATGHTPPNPWDAGDAFMAAAILLADNGADRGTRSAERLAALRYLAGWKNASKPAYAFYGDEVMEFADKYQGQIDILSGR